MSEIVITKHIGSGGNGEVYKGYFGKSPVECVVKKAGNKRTSYIQLKNEAKILKYLEESGFVEAPVLFKEKDGELVMSLVSGRPLDEIHIEKMSERELKKLFIDMVSLVVKLHSLNPPVIHRDLKPANIMLDDLGHLALIDFGRSKIIKGFLTKGSKDESDIFLAGTKSYAAPEQYGGLGSESFQVDIYQLGKIMERMMDKSRVSNRFNMAMRQISDRCLKPCAGDRYLKVSDIRKDLMNVHVGKNIFVPGKIYRIFRFKFLRKFSAKGDNSDVFIDIVRTYDTIEFL